MAVAFEGGVVIGADSRTTTGSYIVSISISNSSRFAREAIELLLTTIIFFCSSLTLFIRLFPAIPLHRFVSRLQANRVTDKLTHIHDRVYCCRSGSAADTQVSDDP